MKMKNIFQPLMFVVYRFGFLYCASHPNQIEENEKTTRLTLNKDLWND